MNKNQRGFNHTILILIFVLLGLIVFAVWNVSKKDLNMPVESKSSTTSEEKTETSKVADITWETYKNDEAGITFKYPNTWKSEAADTFRFEDGELGGVGGTVTSPGNNKLTWTYMVAGGKGGDCEPAKSDVPFGDNNKCSSKQIISVEKAQKITSPSLEGTSRQMFEDNLYITHTKYRSTEGPITYQICLDPYTTVEKQYQPINIPKVSTSMGLIFPCAIWDTGFNVKFEVKDEADFASADAITAEKIMKSFNSL